MQSSLKQLQRQISYIYISITFILVTYSKCARAYRGRSGLLAAGLSGLHIVMRDGVIEQDGTPREIYEEPKNLFVARFIGEINVFEATAKSRQDESALLRQSKVKSQLSITIKT